MSVVINHSQSEVYFGNLKVATAAVKPGAVVVCDDSAGTCAAPSGADNTLADGTGLYLVTNYDSYADTDLTDSKDFTVAIGKYARLKPFQAGDVFTTDCFVGTYADIDVDDEFAVNSVAGDGTVGHWIDAGVRTPALKVKVVGKTTIYGQNALKFRVLSV